MCPSPSQEWGMEGREAGHYVCSVAVNKTNVAKGPGWPAAGGTGWKPVMENRKTFRKLFLPLL